MTIRKETKKVLYTGYPGDKDTPYVWHGISFGAREVTPVSDDVYEAVKSIRGFVTVNAVRNSVLDFSGKLYLGSESFAKEDNLVLRQF